MKKTTFLVKAKQWHRKKLKLLAFFAMLLTGQVGLGQDVATQTFSANGYDDSPAVMTITPEDITVNDSGEILGVVITGFENHYNSPTGEDACYTTSYDDWFSFNLTVVGGESDGTDLEDICGDSMVDLDVTGFTSITISTNDTDYWSDMVYFNLTLEVTYGDPPACIAPTALSVSDVSAEGATISWTSDGDSFELKYGVAGFDVETVGTSVDLAISSYNLTDVEEGQAYDVYVRRDCGTEDGVSSWTGPVTFTASDILVYPGEISTDFVGYSGATTNTESDCPGTLTYTVPEGKWIASITTEYSMTASTSNYAYKSEQESYIYSPTLNTGESNIVYGSGSSPGTQLYSRTLTFANEATGTIEFELRAFREYGGSGCGSSYQVVDSGSWKLIIELEDIPTCLPPTNVEIDNITSDSAELTWEAPELGNEPEDGYVIEIRTGGEPGDTEGYVDTVEASGLSADLTGLDSSTSYVIYIKSLCTEDDDESLWVGPISFTTTQVPATLDYEEDFEGTIEWTLVNGTQTNQWVVGAATGNTGNSLYISNDGGDSNEYSHNTSTVHAYRDVQIPDDAEMINLSFDWKAGGESIYDYIRVWIVPTTYIPVAGTQISTSNSNGIQIGGYFNLNTTFTTANFQIPSTDYQGQIVRLAFEWRNDSGAGVTDPAGAIDNVNIEVITCVPPTELTATDITTTAATLDWTSDGDNFDIEIVEAGEEPTGTPTYTGVDKPFTITIDLSPSTTYEYYVRQDCGDGDVSPWIGPFSFATLCGTIENLPYTENFDIYGTGSDAFPNCWERPVTYTSSSVVYPSIVSAYSVSSPRSLRFQSEVGTPTYAVSPAFAEDIHNLQVSFRLRREGIPQSGTIDVGVMSDPNDVSTFELVQTLDPDEEDVFLDYTIYLNNTTLSGGNRHIALRQNSNTYNYYYWLDDFVVDEIPSCLPPSDLMVADIIYDGADLSWTANGDLFDVEIVEAGEEPTGTPTNAGVANPYTVEGLESSTAYEYYVRQDCGDGDISTWVGPISFTTTQVPATLDYEEDFEGTIEWTLVNGTQTNQWVVGDATGNTGNSLYISNDGGESNEYSHSTSTVHAYRDIQIPDDAEMINLSFDWKAGGESTYDYIRVWVVPTTYIPVAGTQTSTSNSNGVQIGGYFNLNTTFTTASFQIPSEDYQGQNSSFGF